MRSYELTRFHEIRPVLEHEDDGREAEHGLGAQRQRNATPWTARSMGVVTRVLTSIADNPGASVWISTRGGANSWKTSTCAELAARHPTTRYATAPTTTTNRRRKQRSISVRIGYFPGAELVKP